MARAVAVVPAAGSGSRMGLAAKKQFLCLAGIPVVGHVLKVLGESPAVGGVVLVVAAGDEEVGAELCQKYAGGKWYKVVRGGSERQESVYRGLCALPEWAKLVLVHDGARPFLTDRLVTDVLRAAAEWGAATAAVLAKDTVKTAGPGGFVRATLPREEIWLAQTPQAFRRDLLLAAHEAACRDNCLATDDCALVERCGCPVKIVPGSYANFKITTPEDMAVAEALAARKVIPLESGGLP